MRPTNVLQPTAGRARIADVVNHDASHQLCGRRDKVAPALPDRLRIIDQPQVGFVENSGGLQGVPGALPAHVMMGEPVQFQLHQRD